MLDFFWLLGKCWRLFWLLGKPLDIFGDFLENVGIFWNSLRICSILQWNFTEVWNSLGFDQFSKEIILKISKIFPKNFVEIFSISKKISQQIWTPSMSMQNFPKIPKIWGVQSWSISLYRFRSKIRGKTVTENQKVCQAFQKSQQSIRLLRVSG